MDCSNSAKRNITLHNAVSARHYYFSEGIFRALPLGQHGVDLYQTLATSNSAILVNIQTFVLNIRSRTILLIPENVIIALADTGGPQNCHVKVAKVFQASLIWLKVFPHVVELIFSRHTLQNFHRHAQ